MMTVNARTPVVAIGVVVKHFDAVLLVMRNEEWQIPSAELRWQETIQQAVVRIVQEQAGVNVAARDILLAYDLIVTDEGNESHVVVMDFEADYKGGDLSAGDAIMDVAWASGLALKSMTVEENTAELLSDLGFLS